jgi:hypothetical protein
MDEIISNFVRNHTYALTATFGVITWLAIRGSAGKSLGPPPAAWEHSEQKFVRAFTALIGFGLFILIQVPLAGFNLYYSALLINRWASMGVTVPEADLFGVVVVVFSFWYPTLLFKEILYWWLCWKWLRVVRRRRAVANYAPTLQ